MSKRYGRQQRRKHREAITALASQVEAEARACAAAMHAADEWFDKHGELSAKVRRWENDIRRTLGGYSAFLMETGRLKADEVRPLFNVMVDRPMSDVQIRSFADAPPSNMTAPYATLEKFTTAVRDNSDDPLAKQLLLLIRMEVGMRQSVGYAMSTQMVESMMLGRTEVDQVARMLAEQMIDYFRARELKARRQRTGIVERRTPA